MESDEDYIKIFIKEKYARNSNILKYKLPKRKKQRRTVETALKSKSTPKISIVFFDRDHLLSSLKIQVLQYIKILFINSHVILQKYVI